MRQRGECQAEARALLLGCRWEILSKAAVSGTCKSPEGPMNGLGRDYLLRGGKAVPSNLLRQYGRGLWFAVGAWRKQALAEGFCGSRDYAAHQAGEHTLGERTLMMWDLLFVRKAKLLLPFANLLYNLIARCHRLVPLVNPLPGIMRCEATKRWMRSRRVTATD